MKKKLLVIEDEKAIADLIVQRFDTSLYDVDISTDGNEALAKLRTDKYDLATIDIMLPHVDGLTLCKKFREFSPQTFLIIVSALDEEETKLKGYAYGADDYITKPFSTKELLAKVESYFRRENILISQKSINLQNLSLDDAKKEIKINGRGLAFTPSEYLLFFTLINNPKKLFSREELSYLIYENNLGEIDSRGIDSHISHIRKKIKKFDTVEYIKTVHGQGYIINEH
ncbi:response regulator transcription factor [Sulfurovum sp. NBC37-1]|uniref:response regulator transcription factor n=1 Tax=Sulfurovum sp. (strain NBC37-1) TaxID=387093 RepID=UPI000158757D|nr:response regulator transcription factor [Sulfurovum sp. NBC37-1]BAF72140.1 two-component response regulator [Sulfurovum sp. NBC37-1]